MRVLFVDDREDPPWYVALLKEPKWSIMPTSEEEAIGVELNQQRAKKLVTYVEYKFEFQTYKCGRNGRGGSSKHCGQYACNIVAYMHAMKQGWQ